MKCMIFNRLYSKVILNSAPSLFKKNRKKRGKREEEKEKKKNIERQKKRDNKGNEVPIPLRFGVQPN